MDDSDLQMINGFLEKNMVLDHGPPEALRQTYRILSSITILDWSRVCWDEGHGVSLRPADPHCGGGCGRFCCRLIHAIGTPLNVRLNDAGQADDLTST